MPVYYGFDDNGSATVSGLLGITVCIGSYLVYKAITLVNQNSSKKVNVSTTQINKSETIAAGYSKTIAVDYLNQALDLAESHQVEDAIKLIDKAISLNVESLNPYLYNERGKIFITIRKYTKALTDFERAIKLISIKVGDNEKCLTEFTKNRTEAQERIQAAARTNLTNTDEKSNEELTKNPMKK